MLLYRPIRSDDFSVRFLNTKAAPLVRDTAKDTLEKNRTSHYCGHIAILANQI